MNLNLTEKLDPSSRTWLYTAGLTLLIGLVTVLPQVDYLIQDWEESARLQAELNQTLRNLDELPRYEELANQRREELDKCRKCELDAEREPELRSWLVSVARESGCQVRRIDFGKESFHPWTDKTNPLEAGQTRQQNATGKGNFQLRKQPIKFTVSGPQHAIDTLLTTLDQSSYVKHPATMTLRRSDRQDHVRLELSLWFFALSRHADVS